MVYVDFFLCIVGGCTFIIEYHSGQRKFVMTFLVHGLIIFWLVTTWKIPLDQSQDISWPSAKQQFFFLFKKKFFIRKPLCPLWPGQTFWQTDKFLQIFVTPGSSSHLLCACARCVPPHFNLAGDNWRLLIRLEFTYQTGGWWGFKPPMVVAGKMTLNGWVLAAGGCFFQWFRHKFNPYPCNPGSKCNCK